MVRCSQNILAASLFLLLAAPVVSADPISMSLDPALTLTAAGGNVDVFFAGSDAGFDSEVFLSSPDVQGPFFPNHSTSIGESVALGAFTPGTELIFRLHVLTTGDDFFTGPAGRNSDGVVHATFTPWAGTLNIPAGILVGFEDLRLGGDRDFNDVQFVVHGAQLTSSSVTPEPASLMLFGTGLLGLLARVRSRQV